MALPVVGATAALPPVPAAPPASKLKVDAVKSRAESQDESSEAPPDEQSDASDDEPSPRSRFFTRDFWHGFSSCFISMITHAAIVIVLAIYVIESPEKTEDTLVVAPMEIERPEDDLLKTELDQIIEAAVERNRSLVSAAPEVGVAGDGAGAGGPASGGSVAAPVLDNGLVEQLADSDISVEGVMLELPPSRQLVDALPSGTLGDPRSIVDNYQQAMDMITQEIMWMMSRNKVLVVWCFDESESMKDDQKEIRERFTRVYTELGLAGGKGDESLLTAITSYGRGFNVHTKKPTSDFSEIRLAIDAIPIDPSGEEMMCTAVGKSIALHRQIARQQDRQMALVLVTDESGDRATNDRLVEQAIAEAKAAQCRIYILGREAVFGYPYAHIRWLHPQTKRTHWLRIDRGPETAFVEQLQTDGFHRRHDAHPSGFGPYEQTRMARETGGVFFLLPSVETNLVRGEKHRYELEMMRPYVPDIRSRIEVILDRDDSQFRQTLWKIINDLNPYDEQISRIIEMRMSFSPQPDAFLKQAREEQAKALAYLPYLARAQKELEKLQKLREREVSPRWQANYDLMYAQLVAYQARIYEYGAYLEWFIKNPKRVPLTKSPNLTMTHWEIRTRKQLLQEDKTRPYIDEATEWFQAVQRDHEGTPWAARAKQELARGFGVELIEVYEPPYPTPSGPVQPVPKF